MGLFSKELYMLDRNTERYMFEEMQREAQHEIEEMQREAQHRIEEMQNNLNEMENKYHQSMRNTVSILRGTGLSDEEIADRLRTQYQIEEMQINQYL